MSEAMEVRQILGVNFYVGDAEGAIERLRRGGLLVAPSAPSFKAIANDDGYRSAVMNADLVITDSALMVMLWNFLEGDSIPRLSGLKYLRVLLEQEEVRKPGNTLWVMPSRTSEERNIAWLESQGIEVLPEFFYRAPVYGSKIEDPDLLMKLERLRPKHVIVGVGGGTQEPLGHYLKNNLSYLPAIHCIGAAIAFLSGDQVRIPEWADRLFLGWLFRCLSSPRRFVPRYLSAPGLIPLLWRFRNQLPVPASNETALTQTE